MRICLVPGCLAETFYPQAIRDSRILLEASGAEVFVPPQVTCCGQPAWSNGHPAVGRELATALLDASAAGDYIVLPSGSCAAMLRVFTPPLLETDSPRRQISAKVHELIEFLDTIVHYRPPTNSLAGRRIVVHHGCHARRELAAVGTVEHLLEAAGATVLDWKLAAECCGFGGSFAVNLPEVSVAMADRKLDALPQCDCVVTPDPGCLMQLAGRAERRGLGLTIRHAASLLREAEQMRQNEH